MDYEKAYKEALERAKAYHRNELAGTRKEMTEYIFPELCESEDERIRKALIDALKPSETVGELKFRLPEPTREEAIAYLEKKKENPKSADSIPSDCVSDAKCEDRWHKVGDSLPDNPREVLCKDEAGNYFIGRYYVGEGWDISNYDDEDKPHHLNPPVSKWIDFPSEKQKEQSIRDFIDDFPYSDQKEPKPVWSEKDEKPFNDVLSGLRYAYEDLNNNKSFDSAKDIKEAFDWMQARVKNFRPQPKQEWSDTNELVFKDICKHLKEEGYNGWVELLKALRNNNFRPFWKPSEEQMEALQRAVNKLAKTDVADSVRLSIMFDNLKKLM